MACAWDEWTVHRKPFELAVIDIDRFKRINDTRGHAAGDEVLKAVAALLQTTLRADDLLSRWGGEEFVVLLTDRASHAAVLVS